MKKNPTIDDIEALERELQEQRQKRVKRTRRAVNPGR